MKKFFKLLLIIIVLTPVTALADMGAPYIKPIDAVVTKKGGIKVKDETGKYKTFAKDETVSISGMGDRIEIYYNGNYYKVDAIDAKYLIPKNKEVKPGDDGVNKLEKQKEFEVIITEMKVYKGPSVIFEEAGTISKGTQATAFYSFETEEAYAEWFYIQEENISGWININSNNGVYPVYEVNAKPLKVIFKKDISINGFDVKANSLYKVNYWGNPYLGIDPVIRINNENVVFDNDDVVDIIADSKKKQSIFHMEQYNFILNKETKLYTTYDLKEELITIPAQTELSTINLVEAYGLQASDIYYLYVNYNNKIGWIKVKAKDVTVDEKDYEVDELVAPFDDPEGDDDDDEEVETTEIASTDNEEKKEKKFNSKEAIIISVIAAISLSVMAISTIFMLNKKNKKDTLKDINEELEKIDNKDKKEDK